MKLDNIKLDIIKWACGPSLKEKYDVHNIFITLSQQIIYENLLLVLIWNYH